jgi:hypothetical protein
VRELLRTDRPYYNIPQGYREMISERLMHFMQFVETSSKIDILSAEINQFLREILLDSELKQRLFQANFKYFANRVNYLDAYRIKILLEKLDILNRAQTLSKYDQALVDWQRTRRRQYFH